MSVAVSNTVRCTTKLHVNSHTHECLKHRQPPVDGGFVYAQPGDFDQRIPTAPNPPLEMEEQPKYVRSDVVV